MTLSEELKWRGFFNQTTYKQLTALDKEKISFYFGVDPSADSMTIGNLAAAMMNRVFIKHGHKAFLLVGGATGMIGDPDGKASERDLLTLEQIELNKTAISAQYKQVFGGIDFEIVDNYNWFKDFGYLQFLREVGKHVPMRVMLGREFVQSRLGEDGEGISYAEFSYSLIQGYDFVHLYNEHGVTLQLCGADQWGNSIAGVDLIRRISGGEAHVYSMPLVINRATGKKFGKTEDGAVWLDEKKTSVYKYFQFWINVDDEGVEDYIKIYTQLGKPEVDELMALHRSEPSARHAQRRLAYESTKIVHGELRASRAEKVTEALFRSSNFTDWSAEDFDELSDDLPSIELKKSSDLVSALTELKLAASKTDARRLLESNAIYINGSQLPLSKTTIDDSDSISGHCIIRKGKNSFGIIKII